MGIVTVEGVFMGAQIKSSTFDGNTKTALYVDVYQPASDLADKVVQLKSDDVALYQTLTSEFAMGSVFKAKVAVNAYKNKAYYKLLQVQEA